jgi:hypothetical protein
MRTPVRAAEELGNECQWRYSLRQRVPMSSVSAEDHIVRAKVGTHSDCYSFLTHISVAGTVDEATLVRSRELLFATANEHHLAIKLKQYFPERQSGTGRHDPKSP